MITYLASPYTATEKQIDEWIDHCDWESQSWNVLNSREKEQKLRKYAANEIMQERFELACEAAGKLMSRGEVVISAIAHSHPIAVRVGLPKDWEYWKRFDTEILSKCGRLLVLKLEGWQESKGVAEEIKIAQELGLPVEYMEPDYA